MKSLKRTMASVLCVCMLGNLTTPAYGSMTDQLSGGGKSIIASASDSEERSATDSDAYYDDEFGDFELIDDVNLASDSDAEEEEFAEDGDLATDSVAEPEEELATVSDAELVLDGDLLLNVGFLAKEVPITSLEILNKPVEYLYLSVGDTYQLEVGVEPEDATGDFSYSVSDSSISVSEDGLITAESVTSRTAWVTVRSDQSYSILDSIGVKVVDDAVRVSLHAIDGQFPNGKQSLDVYVEKGSSIYFNKSDYEPSMEGKLYTGKWYADAKCTDLILDSNWSSYYYPEDDIDLYTKLLDFYTIRYDYNGVSYNGKDSAEYVVTKGESLSNYRPYIPANTLMDNGSMFVGWKNESGNVLTYNELRDYFPQKDETLTAEWTQSYYTVTLDYNGVSYGGNDSTVCYVLPGDRVGTNPYFPSDPNQLGGKMFVGWKTEAGEVIENAYYYVPKKTETLTAVWTEDYYTITFDYNGVSYNNAESSVYYVVPGKAVGSSPYFPSDPDKLGGKLFSHWQNEKGKIVDQPYSYVPEASETITAVWVESYYTITFDYNGVSYNNTESSVYYVVPGKNVGSSPSFPSDPNRLDGKLFQYWVDSSNTKIANIYYYVPESSETLTAVWTEDYYTIHFTGSNGRGGEIDQYSYVLPGESLNNIPSISGSLSTEGKTLLGWQNADDEVIPANSISYYRPGKSEVLKTLWSECYKVTFDTDGGTMSTKTEYVAVGQPVTKASTPTKAGYKFIGWYEKESGIYAVNRYYIPEKDVTLVARWGEYWTVTYDANGGVCLYDSYKSSNAVKGESVYLNSSGFEREGYTLAGWCKDAACRGEVLTGNYTPESDITLYAKWGKTCRITFDAGEGSFSDGKKTSVREVAEGTLIDSPSVYNKNASLDGWYTADGVRWSRARVAEGDVTFYAKWISNNTHTVTFHGGGQYLYDREERQYVSTLVYQVEDGRQISEASISRDGYDCTWYLDASFKTPYNFNAAVETDLDLYARWVKCVYITWDAKGGRNSSGKSSGNVYVGQGEAYNLPDVTKDGYSFAGWYTKDGQLFDEQTHLYENIYVYAAWTEGYRVTLDLKGGELCEGDSAVLYVKPGERCRGMQNPKKDNAAFTGWFDEKGNKLTYISSFTPAKDTVLTAGWTTDFVRVTLHAGDSSIYDPYTKDEVNTLVVCVPKDSVLPYSYHSRDPRQLGMKAFAGWSLTEDGTDIIDEDTYIFKKDTDLYPVWGDSWTVIMDYMGGFYSTSTGRYTSKCVVKGTEITNPSSQYMHREGYTFDGWYENTDYTGKKYEIPFTPQRNMRLYAKWIKGNVITYTVSFDTGGGTAVEPQQVVYEESAVKPENPKKGGSIFDGWYTEPQFWSRYQFHEAVYKDITLYAKWLETTDVNDADITVSGTYTYTGEVIIPELQVSMGGQILTENIDYTVTGNSVNAGQGYVTVKGIGDYTGECQVAFKIEKADLPVMLPMGPFTAVFGDTLSSIPDTLLEGWEWKYPDSSVGDAGNHKHQIIYRSSDSNYRDAEDEVTVNVSRRSLEGAEIVIEDNTFTYTGEVVTPKITVYLDSQIVPAMYYTLAYANNINAGENAKVIIEGSKNYVGTVEKNFTIEKADPELSIGNPLNAIYGQMLSDVELPSGWVWQNPDTPVDSTGSTAFLADYTAPADSNYNSKKGAKLKVSVQPRSITLARISIEKEFYIVTGSEIEPVVTVTDTVFGESRKLVENIDYVIAYSNNVNVGEGVIEITGKGNYKDFKSLTFQIINDPYNIADAVIVLNPRTADYTGMEIKPAVTVTLAGKTLIRNTDYTVAYADNVEPGYGTVTVTGTGTKGTDTYYGEKKAYFFIRPVDYQLKAVYSQKLKELRLPGGWMWQDQELFVGDVTEDGADGRAFKADFRMGDMAEENVDFFVKVSPKNINDSTVKVVYENGNPVYDPEKPATIKVTITDQKTEKTLEEGIDYVLKYQGNDAAGQASVMIEGINNYTGTRDSHSFTIDRADGELEAGSDKLSDEVIYLTIKDEPFFLYAGHKGDGEISFTSSNEAVFKVEKAVNDFNDAEDGRLTVTGIGEAVLNIRLTETPNYKGAELVYRVVVSAVSIGVQDLVLKQSSYEYTGQQIIPELEVIVDGVTLTEGTDYTVAYGENIKAGKNAGSVTVTGIHDYTGTVKMLFDIQKAENPTELPGSTEAVYGQKLSEIKLDNGWSWKEPEAYAGSAGEHVYEVYLAETENYNEKSGEVSVLVAPKMLTEEMITLEYTETEYDTSLKKPSVTADDNGLISEEDFTVAYADNQEIGTAKVLIEGKNNYKGSIELSFAIKPGVVREANLKVSAESTFDGTQQKPVLVVAINGYTLKEGTDYTVTYGENIHAGEQAGTAVVTGIGKFSGTAEIKFAILQAVNPQPAPGEITVVYGQKLSEVTLPDGWKWKIPDGTAGNAGTSELEIILPETQDYLSKTEKITVTVEPKALTEDMITVSGGTLVFDGEEKCPDVSVKDASAVITKKDYTVKYDSNIHAGTGKVTVSGTGNYQGSVQKSFRIEKAVPVLTVQTGPSLEMHLSAKSFSVGAKISNGGALQYTSSDETVAAVDGSGTVTLLKTGTAVITVRYAGSRDYQEASAEIALRVKRKTGGGSGSGSGGSGSSGGSTQPNVQYTCLPEGYTGETRVIGHVKVPSYVVSGGWSQIQDGNWNFSTDGGDIVKDRWIAAYNPYADVAAGQSAYDWFLFDANGCMMTGWYTDAAGDTYYLNPVSDNTRGRMATGWWLIDEIYYYFNEVSDGKRGRLLKDTTTPDGWYVDRKGARVKKTN